MPAPDETPDDIDKLRATLAAEQAARREAEARASGAEALVLQLKLLIAKLKHDKFGASAERGRKLIDHLELQLDELVTAASEAAAIAEKPAPTNATADRPAPPARKPKRPPLPEHLPRERVVVAAPTAWPRCGGRLSKLGGDVTETLEVIPLQWKVVQTVRKRFSCRSCEVITQPPAPFHPIVRDRARPNRLAMILEAKFGQHLPLNRQSENFTREGIELSASTLADCVGTCTAMQAPLLARDKTVIARLWTYARNHRPFGDPAPPAAMFRYPRDRTGEHPQRHLAVYAGILQGDAYARLNELYSPGCKPGPITEAACWAHGRRKMFKLAEVARAPLAAEAERRIALIFAAERAINRLPAEQRLALRQKDIAPPVSELEGWMRETYAKLSCHSDLAKAMHYMLTRWEAFSRFLGDGRICVTNNVAGRALRRIALGRKAWLFAGSDRGGERAAAMYSPTVTAKMNDVDRRGCLPDVLARIADRPATRLREWLPRNWKHALAQQAAAA